MSFAPGSVILRKMPPTSPAGSWGGLPTLAGPSNPVTFRPLRDRWDRPPAPVVTPGLHNVPPRRTHEQPPGQDPTSLFFPVQADAVGPEERAGTPGPGGTGSPAPS